MLVACPYCGKKVLTDAKGGTERCPKCAREIGLPPASAGVPGRENAGSSVPPTAQPLDGAPGTRPVVTPDDERRWNRPFVLGSGFVILIVVLTVGERIREARNRGPVVPPEFEQNLVTSQERAATPIRAFVRQLKPWLDGEAVDGRALAATQGDAAAEAARYLSHAESIDAPDFAEARSLRMRSRELALEYRDLATVAFPAIVQIAGDGQVGTVENRELAARKLKEALVSVDGSEKALQWAQQQYRWVVTKGPDWK